MNSNKQLEVIAQKANEIVLEQEGAFTDIASIHSAVDFKREAAFAYQILKQSSFLVEKAIGNPESLKAAITNIAAIGLSLNPATKHAYLVPRDGKVMLDVSYMGMIHLATESGAILWAKGELVRKGDNFKFMGVGSRPVHEMNPFGERGEIEGAYCLAKTRDGEYLVETMSIKEIYEIRDRSAAFSRSKSGPWKTDEGEMIKKTVIKRAAKTWPRGSANNRLATAIDVVNEHEGINFNGPVYADEKSISLVNELVSKIQDGMKRILTHLSAKYQKEISTIEELTKEEADYAIEFLRGYIKNQEAL